MSQNQRSIEALRTLREQAAFVSSIQKKNQSKTAQMERILSSSIQKAKEKLQNPDLGIQPKLLFSQKLQLKGGENINTMNLISNEHNRNKSIQSGINSSAVASALKCLQTKVSNLQNQNKQYVAIISDLKTQNERLTQNNLRMEECIQQSEQKMRQFQNQITKLNNFTIPPLKQKIRQLELTKQKQIGVKNSAEINTKNQLLQKERQFNSRVTKKQKELQQRQKQLSQKIEQISLLEKYISQRQSQLYLSKQKERERSRLDEKKQNEEKRSKQIDHSEQLYRMNEKYKQIFQENIKLMKEVEIGKNQIFKLETQIEVIRQSRELNNEQQYLQRIETLQQQVKKAKDKNKFDMKIEALKNQKRKLIQELQSYQAKFGRLEARLKDEQKEAKLYKNKHQETKDLLNEVVAKLKKLPSGVSSEFKYLIVKIGKLDKQGLRSDRSYSKISYSGSKSERMRSNSKTSRSKSLTKKTLKVEDLDRSRESSRSSVSRKSRVIYTKGDSSIHDSLSKSQSKKKPRVTKNGQQINLNIHNMTDKEMHLSVEKNQLQKAIFQIKKEYKALQKLNYNGDAQMSDKLNELSQTLESKINQLTDLKIKLKHI